MIYFDQISPKRVFPIENWKNAPVRVSMVVNYYVKLFRTGADRFNGILMSLLLVVVETINYLKSCKSGTLVFHKFLTKIISSKGLKKLFKKVFKMLIHKLDGIGNKLTGFRDFLNPDVLLSREFKKCQNL